MIGRQILHPRLPRGIHQHPDGSEGAASEETIRSLPPHELIMTLQESFYGKRITVADRDMVETQSDEILQDADKEDVSLLIVGDPFGCVGFTVPACIESVHP